MPTTIEYFFSLASPWTFLGHERLMTLSDRKGVTIDPYPVDFSAIFPKTGGLPVKKRAPARQAYRLQELRRWHEHLGIAMNVEPQFFPVDDKPAASIVIALRKTDPQAALRFAGACLRAVWAEQRDIATLDTLNTLLRENDLDAELIAESGKKNHLQTMRRDSLLAVHKGVFGAPSYFLPDTGELFWGQDRLDFLERALSG